jgi:hypothetical protein
MVPSYNTDVGGGVVWKWSSIDASGVEWLRRNPNTVVTLDRSWLDPLRSQLDLRAAQLLGRTKFGWHLNEYRESREERSLHVREFPDHLEVHADAWNPDWSAPAFLWHLAEDTPALQIGLFAALTTVALRAFLG